MKIFRVFTRSVGYGSQATIIATQGIQQEANYIEICLLTVKLFRWELKKCKQTELDVYDLGNALYNTARRYNWPIDQWHKSVRNNTPVYDEFNKYITTDDTSILRMNDIISLMNFIYLMENKRKEYERRKKDPDGLLDCIGETFEKFSTWCSNTFPKLIPVIKDTIPAYVNNFKFDLNRNDYSNTSIIRSLIENIRAISQFNRNLRTRYDLDKDTKLIKERKKAEAINIKRADFICQLRAKIEEDIEPRIRSKWQSLQNHCTDYDHWQNKINFKQLSDLHVKSLGYQEDMSGLLSFWTNLLKNENLNDDLIKEIFQFLTVKDVNYNFQTSPNLNLSPSVQLTPIHQHGQNTIMNPN